MSAIQSILVIILFLLNMPANAAKVNALKHITIITYSSESRYIEGAESFIKTLRKNGYGVSQVSITEENAEGNKAKVIEIINKVKSQKPDLIVSMGTSATSLVIREFVDIPVVFAIVYDPIEARIAYSWNSSGNNTTGTTTYIPMNKILKTLISFAPIKRLAVLYTPSEKNAEAQLKNLQIAAAKTGLIVSPVPLANKEDVDLLLPEMLKSNDAFYITGSALISSQIPHITEMAAKAKVVTITHLDDLVKQGVMIGLCANSQAGGKAAAEKAIKILRGAKPSSIPIAYTEKMELLLNMKRVKEGNFLIPDKFLKTVNLKIE